MPASSRRRERAPSAATRRRAGVSVSSGKRTATWPDVDSNPVTAADFKTIPSSRALTSPPKLRKTGRTLSLSRLSVTAMSRIGCASCATASHTPIVSNNRRAPAAIAEARRSPEPSRPMKGSATMMANAEPSPWRSAMPSASPAKPPPAITTSARSIPVPEDSVHWSIEAAVIAGSEAATWKSAHCQFRKPCYDLTNDSRSSTAEPRHVRPQSRSRYPRSGAARSEPVPRSQPAVGLAARVRRAGDRPSAGCRLPHGRGPPAAFHARLFPAPRRSQGADHLRGRPHSRRQELHHASRGGDPAWPSDLFDVGFVPQRRARAGTSGGDARCAAARSVAERIGSRRRGAAARAGSRAALLRARAPDRDAAGGIRALFRQEIRGREISRLDPDHGTAARRPGHSPMRAGLCVGPHPARHGADAVWPHLVRAGVHGREPRPCALVPSAVPRRRLAALRPGQPQSVGRARTGARVDLCSRRHAGGLGRPGGNAARAPAGALNPCRPERNLSARPFALDLGRRIVRYRARAGPKSRGWGATTRSAEKSMKLVIAIIKPFKLDDVRDAIGDLGIAGLTVTEVKGYGRQRGHTEIYRGAEYAVNFLPKLKIEVAVPADRADKVVDAITSTAKTGQIGDGKIFVLDLEHAVRIRTGETDADAL